MFSSTWPRSWSGRAYGSKAPSRDWDAPIFVVITRSSAYGCSAAPISSFADRVGKK